MTEAGRFAAYLGVATAAAPPGWILASWERTGFIIFEGFLIQTRKTGMMMIIVTAFLAIMNICWVAVGHDGAWETVDTVVEVEEVEE